ncbi:MarR family transcriptional regulator [Schnuerera sp. xch1]|uniref:MarR family winged helix-turn-helix transcriptional regulator n=1 Tax=Schnuerera sp. xch1 TaxID=2874283 RepID=UPI001CBF68A7|nr:MarR family transcriptional regulator [Schnuerera sp. xch1]MBZ2175567.1 MarR family transcriptional regulator [Schnuerera sp. xch1]
MKNCPDDYIGRWFSVLHRLSLSFVYEGLKEYNIGSGQIMFLLELYYCDGISQEKLSSYLSIDGSNTTRAIKKLEQEGYVIRRPDENDKRIKRIYLTDKAIDIKPKVLDLMNKWENKLLNNLTGMEGQVFVDLIKRMGHSIVDNNRCAICDKDCC